MPYPDSSINSATNAQASVARSMQPVSATSKVRQHTSKSKTVDGKSSSDPASESADTLEIDLTTEISADRDPQERATYRKQDIIAKAAKGETNDADDDSLDLLG